MPTDTYKSGQICYDTVAGNPDTNVVPMLFDPTASDADWSQAWTVAAPLVLTGVGLHGGQPATARIVPAPAGHGLVFHRVDLPGSPPIPARHDRVVDTTLSTTLGVDGCRVSTVEHLIAGLAGMGVSDARIEIDGPEAPILDGSAAPVVAALLESGVALAGGARPMLALPPVAVTDGEKAMRVAPDARAAVTYVVDYGHPLAGVQIFHAALTPAIFAREIAPARTFCFLKDVEAMRKAGLARGGSAENAVVIDDAGYSSPLRFADELVRHKVLDLIGDLALWGASWQGHVIAVKAGHKLHNDLAHRVAGAAPVLAGT